MKALILGDVHGEWTAADNTIQKARGANPDIDVIIQAGDLGDGWPFHGGICRWRPRTADDIPIHWCAGNHDNYDLIDSGELNKRLIYQERGSVLEIDGFRILFIGGATSIDRRRRMPHVSWWPQEAITHADVERALSVGGSVDAVISHDRPDCFPWPNHIRSEKLTEGLSDRRALEAVWEHHRPRFWFHGHWHWKQIGMYEGTEFYSLPNIGGDYNRPSYYGTDYVTWDGVFVNPSWE